MPNHWHLIVWPQQDGELSRFVGWVTLTHTQRWHSQRHSRGSDQFDQGRFKTFPMEDRYPWLSVLGFLSKLAAVASLFAFLLRRGGLRPIAVAAVTAAQT